MGYLDDLFILNVSSSTMYGTGNLQLIQTSCHYLGVMQGEVYYDGALEKRPFVYFTPHNISTLNGWNSPPGCCRKNFYIECSGKRADRIIEAFGAAAHPVIYIVEDPAPYIGKLQEIARLYAIGTPAAQIQQTLCVEEFAALLETELHARRNGAGKCCGIEQTVKAINAAPGAVYNWSSSAAAAGVSLRHWNRLFAAYTGMPPGEYLADCRLKLARQLLTGSDVPIKVIAGQCGFGHTSDFIRFFKKRTGSTPGKFRNSRLR